MAKKSVVLNDRFIEFYNELVASDKIKNKAELASKLGVSPATISEIVSKRQGLTTDFIQTFCEAFPQYQPNDFFNLHINFVGDGSTAITGDGNKSKSSKETIVLLELIKSRDEQINRLLNIIDKLQS